MFRTNNVIVNRESLCPGRSFQRRIRIIQRHSLCKQCLYKTRCTMFRYSALCTQDAFESIRLLLRLRIHINIFHSSRSLSFVFRPALITLPYPHKPRAIRLECNRLNLSSRHQACLLHPPTKLPHQTPTCWKPPALPSPHSSSSSRSSSRSSSAAS